EYAFNFPVAPHPISVTNTNDSGPGSLRQAIFDANGDGNQTSITFDPSLSGASIHLNTNLPLLLENATSINGDINGDCIPDIELHGESGANIGITVNSSNNSIRGLALNRFNDIAILIDGGGATNNEVVCNFLGTNFAGTLPVGPGSNGVIVQNGANNNVIGRPGQRNVIGAFGIDGIFVDNANNTTIDENKIGVDVTGTSPMPPVIAIQLTNANNTVVHGNRIIGIFGGIDASNGNALSIQSNTIGWPASSTPSTGYGIRLNGTTGSTIGNAPFDGNHIENNGGSGIRLEGAGTDFITIRGNAISANGALGIDLDGDGVTPNDGNGDPDNGANADLNFPVLTRATTNGSSTHVEGFLDGAPGSYQIDFYANTTRDPSGYGEGATWLGSISTGLGNFSANLPVTPIGAYITATATGFGNTSEFSLALAVAGPPISATELVAFPTLPTSIELHWRDPQASETGFRVERQFEGGGWNFLTTVGPDTTTYVDTNLGPSQSVWYRVIATSLSGDAPASNVAFAISYATSGPQICRAQINSTHQFADTPSVAYNGTNWAVAWEDQRNGRASDIYFQLMNLADGSPIGAPVQVTNDDVPSRFPSLVWNGTNYGLLWFDHIRQPNGDVKQSFSFALLGPTGTRVRGDIKINSGVTAGPLNPDAHMPLVWDGNGWGIFVTNTNSSPADLVYYRLDPDGDVLVNGLQLTGTFNLEGSISAAWNGSEYGIAFVRQFTFGGYDVVFQRMQPNGTLTGPLQTLQTNGDPGLAATSVIWDGSGWAVAWTQYTPAGDAFVYLNRLNASGTPLGAPVRISDDVDAFDEFPKLFVKPGGGYVIYTTSFVASGAQEIGRLEADASGNRVGARTILSADDGFTSGFLRAADSGTSFLLAWEESDINFSEIANAVVSPAGVAGAINHVTTTHAPPSFSLFPSLIAMPNGGFVALWDESFHTSNHLDARIYQNNGSFTDRKPLNGSNPARKPSAVSAGSQFAVAWTDASTNGVQFSLFDNLGNSLNGPSGVTVATPVNVGRAPDIAYDGSEFGMVWVQGGQLTFQRMGHITPIGVPTQIAPASSDPQLEWIGSGWAILWRQNLNLWFVRLDPAGAMIVPPTQVTDTFVNPLDPQLLWTGRDLGIVYAENNGNINPAIDIKFTVIDLNGFKKFAPVTIAGTQFNDRFPSLYFDGTNFRIVYPDYSGGIRDVGVTPTGSLVPSPRFYGNHGEGRIAAAFNGATTAMTWQHVGDLLFQNTTCLADVSAPPCVTLNGNFSNGAVHLNWPGASDPQSGILAYHLYRDGALLTELLPTTFAYDDGGYTPAAVHNYELRPFIGAYLEATGCTPRAVTAGILLLPATLPNGKQNSGYNQTISASQGTPPYTFAITSGALPPGIALSTAGNINGTPASSGAFAFTVTATDSVTATGSRPYTLRICPATTIMPTVLPDPVVNSPYSQIISLIGTSDPYTVAVTGGALPPGLTLASNGTLSGTPTSTGAFNFTVTTTESTTCTTSQPFSFTVISGQAPKNVRADAQSNSSILVRWERPLRGETGFRIERSTDAINWGSINVVGADVTSNLDSGLLAATLYYYRVVAFSGAFDSATSNITAASTFPLGSTKICQQNIGPYHARAQAIALAHDGTKWAAVWNDRKDNLLEEIYFQFLDNASGAPTGSPVRITTTDMLTRFPAVRWNGTRFGVLYSENMRAPDGAPTSTTSFALLDASGNVLRSGVRVYNTTGGVLNSGLDLPLVWDGGGWGVFANDPRSNPPSDLYYYRLSATGDVVTGPVQLTSTPWWDLDLSPAWNGSEYGLAWIEMKDGAYTLRFQRMQLNGTLIGSSIVLDQTSSSPLNAPNLVWNGSEWAVAWMVSDPNEIYIRLRRLNPDGTPIAAAVRISDDPVPDGIDDEVPQLMPKAGGGYHIFVASNIDPFGTFDVARLQADASGNRVGSRVALTPVDSLSTNVLRVATDGSRFMLGYDDISGTQVEAANLIVNASGTLTNGPTPVTTGHPDGNSSNPTIVPVGAGFAAIWNETTTSQLRAKIYNGSGTLTSTLTPLSATTGVRSRVGAVGVGNTFA
ncbi:MAG TPA: putative Ig domain-containing protein, partial [Thermoanaerobaculia bacterium]|nr:putative Ig domain-containing protein [Thermoanaerobaculia bacterium]